MWTAVTTAFGSIISMVGDFLTALISPATGGADLTALLPLFAVGISISLVLVAVRIVRKITWGA